MANTIIDSPDYKGEERRRMLVLQHCSCHPKHERILADHTDMLKEMSMQKIVEHGSLATDIKTKVEKKIFYIFIGIVIGALGVVYNGIHQVDKAVAVLNTQIKADIGFLMKQNNELKSQINAVDSKVESRPHQPAISP